MDPKEGSSKGHINLKKRYLILSSLKLSVVQGCIKCPINLAWLLSKVK